MKHKRGVETPSEFPSFFHLVLPPHPSSFPSKIAISPPLSKLHQPPPPASVTESDGNSWTIRRIHPTMRLPRQNEKLRESLSNFAERSAKNSGVSGGHPSMGTKSNFPPSSHCQNFEMSGREVERRGPPSLLKFCDGSNSFGPSQLRT